jgi:Domain of Unknown Function (DUF1080)
MLRTLSLVAPALLAFVFVQDRPGYDNTPVIPGQKWRVHDKNRPYPPVVTPGDGTAPPSDAIVLFDGKSLAGWDADGGGPAKWKVENGYMEVNGTGSIHTKEMFGDCQLHLEWATPAKVEGDSQGRGNSGVFPMGRYEVQLLDSYQNPTYPDGQAAAIYGQQPPAVNACRKPGEWQSYDIVFAAPRWKDGKLVSKPKLTVFHNGVLVHHAYELSGPVAHAGVAEFAEHPMALPLGLQDHGNPMRFRNIWVRKLDFSVSN